MKSLTGIDCCRILMAQQLVGIKWDNVVFKSAAFVTIITMILTYSISNGIALGFITYTVSMVASGQITNQYNYMGIQ